MGTPSAPSLHSTCASLSISSAVSPPNSSTRSCASAGTTWTTSVPEACAIRYVRFLSEMHTRNRGGSMLHCVAKPTRHPSRSRPLAAVTINIG